MRLAIVNHHGAKPAGAEHSLLLLLEGLPREIELVFFLFEEGDFADELRSRYEHVVVLPMTARVATVSRNRLQLAAIGDSIKLAWRLSQAIRKANVDVVLTNSMKAHVIGAIAARLAGKRCINYLHDLLEGAALMLVRGVSRFCASERLACSNEVRHNIGLARTTVIHSPIELKRFRNLPGHLEARRLIGLPVDDLPVIGLVGRVARWKGQDRFVRIASAIRNTGLDAHFAIVGSPIFGCEPGYAEEVNDLGRTLGLQDRLHFVPWQADMRAVYAALSLACNCSTREPFGRTTVESLASGIPVVCFDDAGVCEIFDDGVAGMQVPAGDEEAFANAVAWYVREPERLQAAREPALHYASALDVPRISERFLTVIERQMRVARFVSPNTAIVPAEAKAS